MLQNKFMANAVASRQKSDEMLKYLNDGYTQLNDKIQRIAGIYDPDALRVLLYSYNGNLPSVTIAIIKKVDDENYLKEFFIHMCKSGMKSTTSIGLEIIKKINDVRLLYELEGMPFTPEALNPIIRNRINYLKCGRDDMCAGQYSRIIRL